MKQTSTKESCCRDRSDAVTEDETTTYELANSNRSGMDLSDLRANRSAISNIKLEVLEHKRFQAEDIDRFKSGN